MSSLTELHLSPALSAIRASLEPHRPWLESVLGCPLRAAVTFELDVPVGQIVAEDLLAGVPLDRECLLPADPARPLVERWELPPETSPRIILEPSRDRAAPVLGARFAWDPHWGDTPVAVWFRGMERALVVADIPHVVFDHGPQDRGTTWVLVNRAAIPPALAVLERFFEKKRKLMRVIGGQSMPLGGQAYDWDRVVLEPGTTQVIRQDFEAFLEQEAWFRRHDLPYRRGYLLYGPPGNGKTSVVRVMAAHPAVTPLSLNFSNEWSDNDVLSRLFDTAGRSAPSLIVFEDLDRLYGRGKAKADNRTKITLQHLLNCLDGLGSRDGVMVVATANDPTDLDPAILRRPGRFDRVVAFRAPGPALRAEGLRRMSRGRFDAEGLGRAVERSEGFSFAQLREAYVVAGQLAFQRGDEEIALEDLLEGVGLVRGETQATKEHVNAAPVGFGPAFRVKE